MTMLLLWRQPYSPINVRWRGPDVGIAPVAAVSTLAAIPTLIGPPGVAGPAGPEGPIADIIDGGTFN